MYSYTIQLNDNEYIIYHEKKFNSVEFTKIYNEIAESSKEYTDINELLQRFYSEEYGFTGIENPITIKLADISICGYANMFTVDVEKIKRQNDDLIDVYEDRENDEQIAYRENNNINKKETGDEKKIKYWQCGMYTEDYGCVNRLKCIKNDNVDCFKSIKKE